MKFNTFHLIGKLFLSLFFLIISLGGSSQEICNNGIDDDGDGFIDLNDSIDCICGFTPPAVVPSLIPNSSFEIMSYCPNDFFQLSAANGWIQATSGTSDYMNSCGFIAQTALASGLVPFPDGNGIVGGYILQDYKEYIGSCLTSPLLSGIPYKIKFHIASSPMAADGEICSEDSIKYGSLNITIFGANNCSSLPVSGALDCPNISDPSWNILGSVNYLPVSSWREIEISFTPTININTIMIGAPCNLPGNYPQFFDPECYPYFFYDNLILNDLSFFGLVKISKTGHYCMNNQILTANISSTVTSTTNLQWYKNGIAISGAIGNNYIVQAGTNGIGDYQIRLIDGATCSLSPIFSIIDSSVIADYSGINEISIPIGSVLNLTNQSIGAFNYKWELCNSLISTNTNVSISLKDTGICCIKLISYNLPCVDSITKCIKVYTVPLINIPNVFTPNGDGKNEIFKITSSGLKSLTCVIFDRWGLKMYEWDAINGYWDGKAKSGSAAPDGTYFYIVTYTDQLDKTTTEKGYLNLFKN